MKIVHIKWVDSYTQAGWVNESQLDKTPLICETVGFLVGENKHSLKVALNHTCNDNYKPYGEVINIPKVSIKSKRILRNKR